MRIFIETNGGVCSFTNKEVDILVGIQEGRKNLLMSRDALEYALKLLNAVDGTAPEARPLNEGPVPRPPFQPKVQSSRPAPKKVSNEMIKAQGKEFIHELMKQKDEFYKTQDEEGDSDSFNNSIIKRAIISKKTSVSKEAMIKVLKAAGLYKNEEIFDSLYNGVLPDAIERNTKYE